MRFLTTLAIALISIAGLSGCHSVRGHRIGGLLGAHGCADGSCETGCQTGDCNASKESSCGCENEAGCDGGCGKSEGLLSGLVGSRPIRSRLQGVGCGAKGCGIGGRLCGRCNAGMGLRRPAPCSPPASGPYGQMSPTYGYPYYTTRGPRDFLLANPPSLGR